MKVLLLSAYDAQSHRRWREVITSSFDDFHWTILTLPPRYFNWRIRGNSLSWAFSKRHILEKSYDLIVATSMVDLSALRGFVPSLAQCPTLLYFHENQFAYPESGNQYSSIEPQVLNLYSALAADGIAFNSAYNKDTFLHGVDSLLSKMPDHVPSELPNLLQCKSSVLPVPLADGACVSGQRHWEKPLSVVWNHRWEYDKAPERLFTALQIVFEQGIEIELHVVGQQFRNIPPVFDTMKNYFDTHYKHCLKHWGFVESESEYQDILIQSDVVISTALHDFQGLAVLEAVAAGCLPLLPNRLCYSEWFEDQHLYDSFVNDPQRESRALAECLMRFFSLKRAHLLPEPPEVKQMTMAALKKDYQQIIRKTIDDHGQQRVKPVS